MTDFALPDPVSPCQYGLTYPVLQYCTASPPLLPPAWTATAVLHPFSPAPPDDPRPATPFFQLCTALLHYLDGELLSAQITGCEYGQWWYLVEPTRTRLSTDGGVTWSDVDMGWSLPTRDWLSSPAGPPVCAGTSTLNWMGAQRVQWWKMPVPGSNATTWIWFNDEGPAQGLPFRAMFGAPPPTPTTGSPNQLAVLQNYSFSYFPSFETWPQADLPTSWVGADIPGFVPGNPQGWQLPVWQPYFGMSTLMTPVDAASDPLPTRVLYNWLPDDQYRALEDRAQHTLMWYMPYNPDSGLISEAALLFGVAPPGVTPPPHAGSGFLVDVHDNGSVVCKSMPFGEEPPYWARIPAVDGAVHASVTDNPTLSPGRPTLILAVLFPPTAEYPQGRYLWTWYSPFDGSDGSHARPVTFMESASTISEGGTSLALADYFDYVELTAPVGATCFAIPPECGSAG